MKFQDGKTKVFLFDFTKGNWSASGDELFLDGEFVVQGNISIHIEGKEGLDEVITPEFAAYMVDDPVDGGWWVSSAATFEEWYEQTLTGNDDYEITSKNYYACCIDYLVNELKPEVIEEKLDGRLWYSYDITFEELGYEGEDSPEDDPEELDY